MEICYIFLFLFIMFVDMVYGVLFCYNKMFLLIYCEIFEMIGRIIKVKNIGFLERDF